MTTLTRKNKGLPGWTTTNRILDDFFKTPTRSKNIVEHEDHFEWSVDMPGVGKENIDVKVDEKDRLHVQTKYEEETEDSLRRRSYSSSVRLGSSVEANGISAEYEDGVLRIEIPKRDPEQNVKHIDVA